MTFEDMEFYIDSIKESLEDLASCRYIINDTTKENVDPEYIKTFYIFKGNVENIINNIHELQSGIDTFYHTTLNENIIDELIYEVKEGRFLKESNLATNLIRKIFDLYEIPEGTTPSEYKKGIIK